MSDTAQQSCSFPLDRLAFDRLFEERPSSTLLNIRRSALIETIVYLTGVILFSLLFDDGTRYINSSFHPFWVIILLVTVQYGMKEALAASLLASVFLLVGNLPEQSMAESTYEYTLRVFSQPIMWVTASLVLGGIRERQLSEKQGLIDELKKIKEEASVITKGYVSLKKAKEQIETRLSEERCSTLAVYNIAKSLETFDSSQALATIEKLVRTSLNPVKFSLYRLEEDGLRLVKAFGWDEDDDYKTRFEKNSSLARKLVDKKRTLTVASSQDEKLLNGEGLIAGPIFDETTGKVFGMLKIEEANFMNLGIRTQEIFSIICAWIARVTANIERYEAVAEKAGLGVADKADSSDYMVLSDDYADGVVQGAT